MASDIEKELQEEEEEVKAQKPEVDGTIDKKSDGKIEMQMERPKHENPHLSVRPVLIFWALVVVLFTAILFFVIGMNYGNDKAETDSIIPLEVDSPTAAASTTVSADASATADVTASWKTYINDTYGFSFKYPESGWTITEGVTQTSPRAIVTIKSDTPNPNKVWPQPGDNHYYDDIVINKETETSVADWISKRLAGGTTDTSKTVTINEAQFTEIVPGSDPNYLAELNLKNGSLLSIIFGWADGRSDITPTQEQILSTFQFTK